MDTRERDQEYVAQLDSSRNLQGVEQATHIQLRQLALAPGQHVLEVGVGTGDFARQIAAAVVPTGSGTPIDVSAAMVATATERSARAGLPLAFQVGDVRLPAWFDWRDLAGFVGESLTTVPTGYGKGYSLMLQKQNSSNCPFARWCRLSTM
jgi:cyclopropane fatty-acyl-phospholipid synthase-like methyltransferase